MNKYLVINKYHGLTTTIDNVGVFFAETPEEAKQQASARWYVAAYKVWVFNLDEMDEEWSYYLSE